MTQPNHPLIIPPAPLAALERVYADAGETMWFVGGCVRDAVLGVECADVDLATTATPERQIELCEASGHRWFGTGLKHGTITVIAGDATYEITTLRRDVETDGRHAEVEWTTDIVTDLGRRDLTINAMAMTFDGRIVDPFDGRRDCRMGTVRFVGDPATRIQEDHLRILRWFRFFGRFGSNAGMAEGDLQAIRANAHLLAEISVERVWSEMKRVLTGPSPLNVMGAMLNSGVLAAIGLGRGKVLRYRTAYDMTSDPAALLAAWQGGEVNAILVRWKASTAERDAAAFVASRIQVDYGVAEAMIDLVDGARRDLVLAVLAGRRERDAIADLEGWEPPAFPIQGRDLVAAGIRPGRRIGELLSDLKAEWISSGFVADRESLIASSLSREGSDPGRD